MRAFEDEPSNVTHCASLMMLDGMGADVVRSCLPSVNASGWMLDSQKKRVLPARFCLATRRGTNTRGTQAEFFVVTFWCCSPWSDFGKVEILVISKVLVSRCCHHPRACLQRHQHPHLLKMPSAACPRSQGTRHAARLIVAFS